MLLRCNFLAFYPYRAVEVSRDRNSTLTEVQGLLAAPGCSPARCTLNRPKRSYSHHREIQFAVLVEVNGNDLWRIGQRSDVTGSCDRSRNLFELKLKHALVQKSELEMHKFSPFQGFCFGFDLEFS